jgi:hypothetical protein
MGRRALLGLLLIAGLGTPAAAQIGGGPVDRYEAMFGEPVEVSIDDLVNFGEQYRGRAVRTRGRLEVPVGSRSQYYILRDITAGLVITPMQEIAFEFESEARKMFGAQVEITGAFDATGQLTGEPVNRYIIQFWKFTGPPEKIDEDAPISASDLTLEDLVSRPGRNDGKTVRVVGKFRGHNLYGDLPVGSRRASADWVIKDDVWAIWVTGKKPKGSGWALDPKLRRDTGKWIEVIGQVETIKGVTYVKAVRVNISAPPTPTADVQAPPPPPPRPKVPPVVVFSLPLDGEREVSTTSHFTVQFSKDMDEDSFEGRIVLRYAGPKLPGDRTFDGLKLSYDGGRRALTVDPGDVLRPGRQIELLLLPGISDVEGLSLEPRPGRYVEGVVDVLRYRVGT